MGVRVVCRRLAHRPDTRGDPAVVHRQAVARNCPPEPGDSTRWYANFFSDSTWTGALINSLQIGVFVAILSTIIATMAALCLTRVVFPGRTLVSASLLSPIIVPAIIVAIGIYAMFLRLGLMGTFVGFTASHTVLAVPFALIPITASLQSFDRRLEQAASVCGASPSGRSCR